jgi:NIMA (never in mitosis gene a)-related kinase 7
VETLNAAALLQVHIFEITDSKARRDCLKEVQLLQRLKHPNIIQCREYFLETRVSYHIDQNIK